ncbi:MAG: hypothetical protein HC835_18440 [Oscillatoriales cyanobacterium RM2_1_1]|nr:hypothetical protein [Oscillatoriales cyanobacterium SM2_3_0]NJO47425.1 hypothetical protein [Oscillatoriales cyanobacterium RM2_1_1]
MQTTKEELSWLEVPPDVKILLIQAAENWEDTEVSEQLINQALAKAEDNLDVLTGSYRYFFYKSHWSMALQMAEKVMTQIQDKEQLPETWEELKPIILENREKPMIRLYLNAYAAVGFVLARLGKLPEAKEISERIKDVDEKRELCSTTVFDVLTRPPEEDD